MRRPLSALLMALSQPMKVSQSSGVRKLVFAVRHEAVDEVLPLWIEVTQVDAERDISNARNPAFRDVIGKFIRQECGLPI